jgi:hypothetical protein
MKKLYSFAELKGRIKVGDFLQGSIHKPCGSKLLTKGCNAKITHVDNDGFEIEYKWFKYRRTKYAYLVTSPSGTKAFVPKKEPNIMIRKLTELTQKLRRLWDEDQKALWKTNRIDDCGKWINDDEANDDMLDKYRDDNKAEYVARAKEEISLAKEESDEN